MEKNQQDFDKLMYLSYGYDKKEGVLSPDWRLVRHLYNNNYINITEKGGDNIPRKIHQIWLGGSVPKQYHNYMQSWQRFHPGWEYYLWTDKNATEYMRLNSPMYRNFLVCKNNGMKSDILRYAILCNIGGVYVDTDFECLKSFDDLLYLSFFTGIAYDPKMVLYNGLIATTPHHPIIERCFSDLDPHKQYNTGDAMVTMDLTGPYYFTRCFTGSVNNLTMGVVAFPPAFHYPLPNNMRNLNNPYQYVEPYSYAIHHWAVSWIPQK